jgi:uncharacterized protein YlbG (UPF0298 family)
MLQKLYDFANKGGVLRRALATFAILSIMGIGGFIGFFISVFICMGIESLMGTDAFTDLSILLFMPTCTIGLPWLVLAGLPGKRKKKTQKKTQGRQYSSILSWNDVVKYGETPHFDKMFGHKKINELLSEETFHLHIFEDGKQARYLSVSESGKWFSLLGGHLPVDLICGYNKRKDELYTIDGVIIKLPDEAGLYSVIRELEKFFRERGYYFEQMPQGARDEFHDSFRKPDSALAIENWGTIRYQWEKELLRDSKKYPDKIAKSNFSVIAYDGSISTDIFERVLSDYELEQTVNAVKNNHVDIRKYLYFNDYKNEYAVCNTIELLKKIGQPKNLEGCDFLFDCLGNIDEPYFYMAVNLLKTYPRRMREEKMEVYAKAAHESGDVEKFGGLLYLAKELKYDIKYVEKMKAEEESLKDEKAEEAKEAAQGQVMQMSR